MNPSSDQVRTGYAEQSEALALSRVKLIRNTYMLLGMTLVFSGIMAAVSVAMSMPFMTYIICIIAAFALMWLVLPRTQDSAMGLVTTFAITGLMGFALGPLLSAYLSLPNGAQVVGTALGGTGVIFFGLSAYALVSRKSFNFLGGFIFSGMLMVLVAAIANIFFQMPALSLAISAVVIMLMCGYILFYTSRMVHGEETNYIAATVGLYVSIFNLFVSLLQILGIMGGDD